MTFPDHDPTLPFGPSAIRAAAAVIAAGGIVAVPTETVYGLAADATDAAAVARIYAAKGRPSFNPLIVHVADLAAAQALAAFDAEALALAEAFWPGPLTLVRPVRAGSGIASLVTAGLDTVAIRVPRHRAMQALLAESGRPLAAPSANASGGISPTRAAHVRASLGPDVPILDDGATEAGLESTIVAGRTILRPGPVTAAMLAGMLGTVEQGPDTPAIVTAPGQLASHYAPRKALRLNATAADADEWLIGFGAVAGHDTLSASGDTVEAAARLFDALHRADASDHARLAVAPIPADGIGEAINDRLRRAATR
ncbi:MULTISPECIES: L-threonylcarbamoyladenylate synthase [unclassified Sphingomonas]|uniref:L-threonylcarbamoyladenylate synthase n=1 Tax=unclassified Sphingomonas TaxID=196159 RepID=UPI00285A6316|nr:MULTISPECIES: L-threonylcarbamoyladenylate synthase [unclassified Sphingomonas]MDR6113920.1 L-threonylcarbamoyladenylate synthase [Sphingomonas sp. SORGH_AS_0789]MDR6148720.1 L-threonylcarbamoyladenylate synthase [Sphingomonas sp. SORGH_AS_0742]